MSLPVYSGDISVQEDGGRLLLGNIGLFNLEFSVECGQAFRWDWSSQYECYEGVVRGKLIRITQDDDGLVVFPPYDGSTADMVIDYFNLRQDSHAIESLLAARDENLKAASSLHPGLKIINQEPWECLISYIISARNNIPSIKRTVASISSMFGEKIEGSEKYTFPTPQALAEASVEDVFRCKAAFRSKYIVETAKLVHAGAIDLDSVSSEDYEVAKEALMSLPGVGPKVADCILLFSMNKHNSFPIDVWIWRAMSHWYFDGREVKLKEIQDYAAKQFGYLAGYANQHLFFHARNIKLGRNRK